MKAVSWNCQGLRSTLTVQALKGHIKKIDPDFIFLMETKNKKEYVERVRKRLKFKNDIKIEPCGVGGRLALWWKEDVTVQTMVCTKNIIDTVIIFTGCGRGCRVFWVYGAPIFEDRKKV